MYTAVWYLALLMSSGDDYHFSNKVLLFFYYEISRGITIHFVLYSVIQPILSCSEASKENILLQQVSQTMMFMFCQPPTPSTLMVSIFVSNPVPFECTGNMVLFLTILAELAAPASPYDRVSVYCQFLCIKINDDSWEQTQDVLYTKEHSMGAIFESEVLTR